MNNFRKGIRQKYWFGCIVRNLYFLFLLVFLFAGKGFSQTARKSTQDAEVAPKTSKSNSKAMPDLSAPVKYEAFPAAHDVLSVNRVSREKAISKNINNTTALGAQSQYAMTAAYVKGDSGKPVMQNSKYRSTSALGQYLIADTMVSSSKGISAGMYAFYQLPPKAPSVIATEGDYADRVEISWSFDVLSPPANIDFFEIKRDKEVVGTVPVTEKLYKDYNVSPGKYYNYTVTGKNKYGTGPEGSSVGFVNPNGTVTGKIVTQNGVPVNDVEVLLTPNLGKSLNFNGSNTVVDLGTNWDFSSNLFTIEFWFKHTSGDGAMFACGTSGNDVSIEIGASQLWFNYGNLSKSFPFTHDDNWHHYAMMRDAAKGTVTFMIDSVANSFTTTATAANVVGKRAYIGNSLYYPSSLYGKVDEMRVWSSARAQADILRNMYRSMNSKTASLTAYLKMDEGTGTKIFDYATKLHSGTITGGYSFEDDRAPIRNSTFTDSSGVYIADGINYGSSTNFTVYPSRPGRVFSPENRLITLSTSNTAVNSVDFTDLSQIPVSGYVYHKNTTCLNDTTIEILVDGKSWSPKVFTNMDGKYLVEFEPGSTHTITPSKAGFVFDRTNIKIDSILAPKVIPTIYQLTTKSLTVKVAGGDCEYYLGGATDITLSSMPSGCFNSKQTIADGQMTTTFTGLPPYLYRIDAKRYDGIVVFEADSINLGDTSYASVSSITKKMIYHSPLVVQIDTTYLPTQGACNKIVLQQLKKYKVRYRVGEQYAGGFCGIDSATVAVTNSIGDADSYTRYPTDAQGYLTDTIYAATPNIANGGLHPYQKRLSVVATTLDNRQAQNEFWALVTGIKYRGGLTFVTRSPDIPIIILRQPPGDQSYSYWASSKSVTTALTVSTSTGNNQSFDVMTNLVPKFTSNEGTPFFSVGTELQPIAQVTGSFYHSKSETNLKTLTNTFTATETISTVPGGTAFNNQGDVVVGVAYNMVFGKTNTLNFDAANCAVVVDTAIISAPDSLVTKFAYTEDFIRNILIPELRSHGANTRTADSTIVRMKDSVAINNWVRLLARNDSLKSKALSDSVGNISFTAGTSISQSRSFSHDSLGSFTVEKYIEGGAGLTAGLFANEAGGTAGVVLKWNSVSDTTRDNGSSTYTETGFTLSDDDPGDFFTVNVGRDKVYNTPVFKTVAGRSSCPHEIGTFTRDSAVVNPPSLVAVNVHPDSLAVFRLDISNQGSSNETRNYLLSVAHQSNPDGLQIAVNGVDMPTSMPLTLPPGVNIPLVITAKRGPLAYDYSNIEIALQPECETDQLAMSTFLSVSFKKPCSNVSITAPEPGWLINAANRDTMMIAIAGYDYSSSTSVQSIKLQYRTAVSQKSIVSGNSEFISNNLIDAKGNVRRLNFTGFPGKAVQKPAKGQHTQKLALNDFISASGYDYLEQYAKLIPKKYHLLTNANASTDSDVKLAVGKRDVQTGWFTFKTFQTADLIGGLNYRITPWIVTGINDGTYDIRAVTTCGGNTLDGYSAIVTGTIAKTAPMVQGQPMPVSHILTGNDQISVTFTKTIDTYDLKVHPDKVALYHSSGAQTGQLIDANVTCDGQTIIITPNVWGKFLENTTLKAVVKQVKDLSGNVLRVPLGTSYIDSLSWEFVVQRSPVRWSGGDISISKYVDETVQVTRQLTNSSGFPNSYGLGNIPSWVKVSSVQGIVPNQGNVPVTFTFGTDLAYGQYDVTIADTTIYGDQPLRIHLDVFGRPPVWTVNPENYQFSMNIIGKLIIKDTVSTALNNKIAFYYGDTIRGVGQLQKVDNSTYLAFITIYSNNPGGEVLQAKIYDSASYKIYGMILENYTFKANAVLGSVTNPVTITAANQIVQNYKFKAGWTWLSVNTQTSDMSVNKVLGSLAPAADDQIKDQSKFAKYGTDHNWFGNLDTIRAASMYQLKLTKADSIARVGAVIPANTVRIPVDIGWNYIGYLPQTSLAVNTALSSLGAKDSNIIKSQYEFAIYTAKYNTWVGSLSMMKPTLGYLLKASKKDTLVYSIPLAKASFIASSKGNATDMPQPSWSVEPAKYQYTMSMVVELGAGILDSVNEQTVLGVFKGNECRGFVNAQFVTQLNRNLFFLMAYGNSVSDESLIFRVFVPEKNKEIALLTGFVFKADNLLGDLISPFVLNGTPLDVKNGRVIPKKYALEQNYPNPFNPTTRIDFALPKAGAVELVIYNQLGRKIRTLVNDNRHEGFYSIVWDSRNEYGVPVPSGVYLYRLTSGSFTLTKKLMLLK